MACHAAPASLVPSGETIALVGQPNVGKSALFHRLTGRYATVSNYPGTTVQVVRGAATHAPRAVVVDTPVLVALPASSEDECLTVQILLAEPLRAVIHVGDAKNLRRTLNLTVQLAETGLPLVVAMNMSDEAAARGVRFEATDLAQRLGVPVVPTVAVCGDGIGDLQQAIAGARPSPLRVPYPAALEAELGSLGPELPPSYISSRALGLLWMIGDSVTERWLRERLDGESFERLIERRRRLEASLDESLADLVSRRRQEVVEALLAEAGLSTVEAPARFAERLGRLAIHPVWGPAVLAVALLAVYFFVGVLGAQVLVGWLEGELFGNVINPSIARLVEQVVPVPFLIDLLVGQYGLWTMGLTYALALILPIVSTFFLAFSLLEDSGYLPRLAVLTHRIFREMGLNGKAVLPMVLGLGCVTTAAMTTRILESRRDRLLATLLLALAVPCSAQLGVVLGMLGAISLGATAVWAGVVLVVLLVVGWLAARLVPGDRTPLIVELPPLRMPQAGNVVIKTAARVEWYLREVVPFFLIGSVAVFLMDKAGALDFLAGLMRPVVTGWLGLPPEASVAILLGFLRRDFGATGLFAMGNAGSLTDLQVLVAMVTITLFIPCLAAVMMISRERGWRTATAMTLMIFPLAFLIGGILRQGLLLAGWSS